MNIIDIIVKKKNNLELTKDEIELNQMTVKNILAKAFGGNEN